MAGLRLRPGHCTVVWHSVMWQYVDVDERAVVREHLARLAAQSSDDAPFAHLYLEPTRHHPDAERDFLVGSEQWPAGPGAERRVLGASRGHGLPVTWER